jgi:hypothetical protein
MIKSSNNNNDKAVDRRTKAELLQELAEAQSTMQKQEIALAVCRKDRKKAESDQKELADLKEKLGSANSDLSNANDLLRENEDLKKKLDKLEKDAAIQIEEATANLHKAELQNQNLEKKIQALKGELEEHKKKMSIAEDQGEKIIKDMATSKSTFLIHLYPHQGHFQGRIEHTWSRDKKPFTGLDHEVVFEFISKHLPQAAEKEKISMPAESAHAEVLKELEFQQMKRTIKPGGALRAYRPFALFTHLHFPVMPTTNNLDIDTSTYEVLVVMTDAKKNNVVARNGVANALSESVVDYKNQINMPALAPGKYWVKVHTAAPFAKIEESKEMHLDVQP